MLYERSYPTEGVAHFSGINLNNYLIREWAFHLHLGYNDVKYYQIFSSSFQQKIETIKYNTALAIIGAIRGSSKEKLFFDAYVSQDGGRMWELSVR